MKKRIFVLFIILIAAVGIVNAQQDSFKKQQAIYTRALTYSDFSVARMAVFNMMELRPNSLGLLDTLALLYFEQQQYLSAAITGQEAVKKNGNNLLALEIAGTSFENLGLSDKALENYEALYLKKPDVNVLYKMSFLQYRMKRYNDAATSADIIISDPKSKEIELGFTKKDKSTQNVSMVAAAYRLKALISFDKKDNAASIQNFKKALEFSPDFELVTEAIKQLEKN